MSKKKPWKYSDDYPYSTIAGVVGFILGGCLALSYGSEWWQGFVAACFVAWLFGSIGFIADYLQIMNEQIYNLRNGK
jgi:hypothetical protein